MLLVLWSLLQDPESPVQSSPHLSFALSWVLFTCDTSSFVRSDLKLPKWTEQLSSVQFICAFILILIVTVSDKFKSDKNIFYLNALKTINKYAYRAAEWIQDKLAFQSHAVS